MLKISNLIPIVCGESEALRAVLNAGADVSMPDINGGTPLHYAAQMCGANYDGNSNQASSKLAIEVPKLFPLSNRQQLIKQFFISRF